MRRIIESESTQRAYLTRCHNTHSASMPMRIVLTRVVRDLPAVGRVDEDAVVQRGLHRKQVSAVRRPEQVHGVLGIQLEHFHELPGLRVVDAHEVLELLSLQHSQVLMQQQTGESGEGWGKSFLFKLEYAIDAVHNARTQLASNKRGENAPCRLAKRQFLWWNTWGT